MDENRYCYKYPHPAVTADCILIGKGNGRLHVLLIQRGGEPFKGRWAFPGGFVEIDESCEDGAVRELEEETGLTGISVEQFHTYSTPGRDPRERIITVSYCALVDGLPAVKGCDDAAAAKWFPLEDVPHPLAFDHDDMLRDALKFLNLA